MIDFAKQALCLLLQYGLSIRYHANIQQTELQRSVILAFHASLVLQSTVCTLKHIEILLTHNWSLPE